MIYGDKMKKSKYDLEKLGDIIRAARIQKNIKQHDIANELDMSQSTYSLIENGKREISLNELMTLRDLLDINIDYLFKNRTNTSDAELAASFKRLLKYYKATFEDSDIV